MDVDGQERSWEGDLAVEYKFRLSSSAPQDLPQRNSFSASLSAASHHRHIGTRIASADPKTIRLGQCERKWTSASTLSVNRNYPLTRRASRDVWNESDGPTLQLSVAVELFRKNIRNEAYTSTTSPPIDNDEMRSLLQKPYVDRSATTARRIGSLAYTSVSPKATQENEAAAKQMMVKLARSQAQGRSEFRAHTPPRRSYDHSENSEAVKKDELRKVEWRAPGSHERRTSASGMRRAFHRMHGIAFTNDEQTLDDDGRVPANGRQTPDPGRGKSGYSRWSPSRAAEKLSHEMNDDDDGEFASEKAGFVNTSSKLKSRKGGARRFCEILKEQRERGTGSKKYVPSCCTCQ